MYFYISCGLHEIKSLGSNENKVRLSEKMYLYIKNGINTNNQIGMDTVQVLWDGFGFFLLLHVGNKKEINLRSSIWANKKYRNVHRNSKKITLASTVPTDFIFIIFSDLSYTHAWVLFTTIKLIVTFSYFNALTHFFIHFYPQINA